MTNTAEAPQKTPASIAKRLLQSGARPLRNALLRGHYSANGLLPPVTRNKFLRTAADSASLLEIGPFDRPRVRGHTVEYFDVLDTAGLRERAIVSGRSPDGVPNVKYVSAEGDLACVQDTFDAVLSYHAIEHQPDLLKHLAGVKRLLKPNGSYFVAIPDKRFTFDYFIPESTYDDAVTASHEQRRTHSSSAIRSHFERTTHNNAIKHWLGLHGRPIATETQRAHADSAIVQSLAGRYVDVHSWIFSPAGFRAALSRLSEEGLIPFETVRVHETEFLAAEFFAVLS